MYGRPRNHYEDALRRRVILNYFEENDRTPTKEGTFALMEEARKLYPNIDSLGFSAFDAEVPHYKEVSSAEQTNTNSHAVRDDSLVIKQKIDDLVMLLEDSYRGFTATFNRCMKYNSSIEARLNNLLLLSGRTDVFVHGMEEAFDTSDFVDLENTTAYVSPGYATLGRNKYIKQDISGARFEVTSFAPNGSIEGHAKSSLRNLLEEDGSDWTYYVSTSTPAGNVSISLTIDLREINPDGLYVGDLRFVGSPTETNSLSWYALSYSLDGKSYVTVEPSNKRFSKGENIVSVGQEGIKKLRLVISKNAADTKDEGNYIYTFSLDSLDISSGGYTVDKESTLFAGPYYITDEQENPINFAIATLSHGTCCLLPSKTSVSFFLSKDNVNWIPASYNMQSLDTVQFGALSPESSSLLDSDATSQNSLITDTQKLAKFDIDYRFGKEALCNVYIPADDKEKFVLQNTYIRRNLRTGYADKELYDATSGWFFDKHTFQYRTTIWVDSFEGRTLDLGSTSAFIDDKLVTGEIYLPRGYHKFSTNSTNWQKVPVGILSAEKLQDRDSLYPFNHKLLVEGYPYKRNYKGDRVYNAIGRRNFGSLLEYITPERFSSKEFEGNLDVYTIEEYNDNLFFKVKIDPSDASWRDEEVEVIYMLRLEESNALYIKAILRTDDVNITPHITRIQVRVI